MRSVSAPRPRMPAGPPAVEDLPVVRFQRPELPPAADVLAHFAPAEAANWFSNGGPCSRALTERISQRLGSVNCVPVASCTLGLMATLRASFNRPRGRQRLVITPSYTFTATACAIEWAGFEPLFVDVDPHGWHLDAAQLEA